MFVKSAKRRFVFGSEQDLLWPCKQGVFCYAFDYHVLSELL